MDHPNPDITAPEGGTGGEPLEGAVRERVLRLHPQAGEGGVSGIVMRKSAGWDQAGAFAAEVMGRFRSPYAVTPMAMPLALPVAETQIPATGSAPVPATSSPLSPHSQRPLPVVGSSSPGRLGPESPVQRKVMGDSDPTISTPAAGTVVEQLSAPEKLVERFHKNIAGPVNYESKADVSTELKSPPPSAGTRAMTARLHGTLGARLVRRHSTFAGAPAEKEAGEGSPFSIQKMPLTAGESSPLTRANEAMGRTSQRRASGEIASGESTVGNADKIPAVNPAVVAAPFVRPPFLKQQREGVSTSPNTAVVQLRAEPSASSLPLVEPTSTATATIQRKVGGASLADTIFARLPNPSFEGAGSTLPLAAPVVASPGTAIDGAASPSTAKPSGESSSFCVPPFHQGAYQDGGAPGENSSPVIQRIQPGGGASGVVSRKGKEAVTRPELSWGGPLAGFSETAGVGVFPRTDFFSPTVAANISASAPAATLPLARMQGLAGSGAVGSIQRKLSDPASVMQRAETADASNPPASSVGTSESTGTFSPSRLPEMGTGTPMLGAPVDLERVADEVYRIIERRLIVEKENRGL